MTPELFRATWIIFTTHLGRTVTSGRALLCCLLALVPLAACFGISRIAAAGDPPPAEAALLIGWVFMVQVLVPLVSLLLGSAAVAEEVEDRTLTYLLTRPIPRAAVLLGRWLAAMVFVCVLTGLTGYAVSSWLVSLSIPSERGIELPDDFIPLLVHTILLGGVVYSALFASLGAFLKRPVLMGLAYTFVVEVVAANAPLGTQKLSIQYYLKSYLLGDTPELLGSLGRELLRVELLEPADALQTLGLLLVGTLVAASWRISRKQFLLAD